MILNNLRKIAIIEGTTLILLMFIAVPFKHLANIPQFVSLLGPIHGIAFLGYLFALFKYSLSSKSLTVKQIIIGIIASVIPFGSFVFKKKVLGK